LNLTNVSSAITDEAKDPPMRTITINANKLFFITAPPFFIFVFIAGYATDAVGSAAIAHPRDFVGLLLRGGSLPLWR
jgi:hypothetical protein